MKISLIETETRTVRLENKRQLEVVCNPMSSTSGVLFQICKSFIKMLRKLFTRLL